MSDLTAGEPEAKDFVAQLLFESTAGSHRDPSYSDDCEQQGKNDAEEDGGCDGSG